MPKLWCVHQNDTLIKNKRLWIKSKSNFPENLETLYASPNTVWGDETKSVGGD